MRKLETVVVGRGLFGAAAGRHLAEAGEHVTVIGPSEPADWSTHEGVFASHYDEGRITRVLDRRSVWAQLASDSIDRYRELEQASGVNFYQEQGFLGLAYPSASGGADYVDTVLQVGAELGTACGRLDSDQLAEQFPLLQTEAMEGAWQGKRAGVISPRRLVAAQTGAAVRAGASLGQDWVRRVEVQPDGVHLTLSSETVLAQRVLIATGAFTEPSLLAGATLPLDVQGRTVVAADVTDLPVAEACRSLPGMIGALGGGPTTDQQGAKAAELTEWYALPAIRYPDGRDYLKIGTGAFAHPLTSLADKQAWYGGGPAQRDVERLQEALRQLIPAIANAPTIAFNCAYTGTPTRYPFIDWLVPGRLAICTGGNGAGAKCSDEVGRLGASLLQGEDVPEVFRVPTPA